MAAYLRDDCPVCRIVAGDDEVILFETKYWRVILSYKQRYLGRMMIVLKRHLSDPTDVTAREWADLKRVQKRCQFRLSAVFGARTVNWLVAMNDAFGRGEPPHVHYHGYPRYDSPVSVKELGLIYEDPNWGNAVLHESEPKFSKDALRKFAAILSFGPN